MRGKGGEGDGYCSYDGGHGGMVLVGGKIRWIVAGKRVFCGQSSF